MPSPFEIIIAALIVAFILELFLATIVYKRDLKKMNNEVNAEGDEEDHR